MVLKVLTQCIYKIIGMSYIFKVRLALLPTRKSFLTVMRLSYAKIKQGVNWIATPLFSHLQMLL